MLSSFRFLVCSCADTVCIPYRNFMFFICFWIMFLSFFSTDIDECLDISHNCHLSANCTNNAGSFSCSCLMGYTGDGISCSGTYTLEIFTIYMPISQTDSIFFRILFADRKYISCKDYALTTAHRPFQREKYCFSGCDYLAVMLSFMTSLVFSHFLLLTLHNLMAWRLLCCRKRQWHF